jgi:hypothetical protein
MIQDRFAEDAGLDFEEADVILRGLLPFLDEQED